MKYPMLFSPCKIGNVTVRNRIVMEPAGTSLSKPDQKATPRMVEYYRRRAAGGIGLVVVEVTCIDEEYSLQYFGQISAAKDEHIPELKKLADAIKGEGAAAFIQLSHVGNARAAANGIVPILSASGIPAPQYRTPTRAMEKADIDEVVEKFGKGALRVKQAGFDGVMIHAGHHYLIQQFLSELYNKRTDEYGGSLENRARFLKEVFMRVREYVGADFPIMVRIDAEEFLGKHGYHLDTGVKLCQWLEEWGVDALDVTVSGGKSRGSQSIEPSSYPQGWRTHFVKAVKKSVKIPVNAVNLVRDPAYAEWMLEQGISDFVGSIRNHVADPEWTLKAREGRDEDIMRCISCVRCLESQSEVGYIRCSVNPDVGYEHQIPELKEDGDRRKVVVVGGGPSGMETAWIAARRNFDVTLYEKNSYLGGQVYLGGVSAAKPKLRWLIETMERRMARAGVEVIMNYVPTIEDLKALEPYAVIDATGGVQILPASIENARTSPMVHMPDEVLLGKVDPRDSHVVVIGSGLTGLETAEVLSEKSKANTVTIIEMAPRIAPGAHGSVRNDVVIPLEANQAQFLLNRKCTKIGEDRIYLEDARTGESYELPCDMVIVSLGVKPANPYGDELKNNFDRVYSVGHAAEPGRILEAISLGYKVGLEL